MSDRDWSDLLDDGWPVRTPPRDFADRVLARVAVPDVRPELRIVPMSGVPPRRSFSGSLVFAAVAVAALVIVPLALHRHATPPHAAAIAAGVAPDLGLERD